MKNLSSKKPIYKALIVISCVLTFAFAYMIFAFGLLETRNLATSIMYVILIGVVGYALFELVASLTYTLFVRFIPNFDLTKNDYKYLLRVFVTFRNIVYGLINIIFIFNPVASIWGVLINYCITTTVSMYMFYFTIKKTYDISQRKYYYLTRMATVYSAFLVIYLMMGSLIWER